VYPKISSDVNYAGELAVIMKYQAKHLGEENAMNYVLGYTCAIDVTADDLRSDLLPTRAKALYTFCPLGPCIATDVDGDRIRLRSRLNGVMMQDASTSEMIFSISRIISFVTEFMALEPGDVIITGSSGRGSTTIHVGDIIEVEAEGIGLLKNRVSSE
jgi:2-keto-4-pentenoate hydratase/2-oxohepta-3-ene-1,7-dioic acid hydratase in catechol pathway